MGGHSAHGPNSIVSHRRITAVKPYQFVLTRLRPDSRLLEICGKRRFVRRNHGRVVDTIFACIARMSRRRKTPASTPRFPSFDTDRKSNEVWFSPAGFILRVSGVVKVVVGGALVTSFEESDLAQRNFIMVLLAQDPQVRLSALARGLCVSTETVRLIRHKYRDEGLDAILTRTHGGSESPVTAAIRRKLEALFAQGLTIDEVVAKVGKKFGIKRSTVGKVHRSWVVERDTQPVSVDAQQAAPIDPQRELPLVVEPALEPARQAPGVAPVAEQAARPEVPTPPSGPPATEPSEPIRDQGMRKVPDTSEYRARVPRPAAPECGDEREEEVDPRQPRSARFVQFAGSWLMVAMLAKNGVYDLADDMRSLTQRPETLRMAIDALTIALAMAGKCVEAVRRLATSAGGALLLATSAPSPNWVRRALGTFSADGNGDLFHFKSGVDLIRKAAEMARDVGRPVVFYVDNHGRPYTGQELLLKIWRMQERRARPGASDYHLANDGGQSLLRVTTRQSLPALLAPMALVVKTALGDTARFLLCFDRAGTFPKPMFEMKSGGAEFVAWEREPYCRPAIKRFLEAGQEIEVGRKTFRILESGANLGKGRGRVRRIWLLTPDNEVLSVLSNSTEDAAWLVGVMVRRWVQENGFKHGGARWGFNQLDGRLVEPVPDEEIIVNPKRRALDAQIERASEREGDLLRHLARLGRTDAEERARLNDGIAKLTALQERLEKRRATEPQRIEVGKTNLSGELVRHTTEYKATTDTIRIACVNAEAELAAMLAPHLKRPREAKRALQNLFQAPAAIRVSARRITLRLNPAGVRAELLAFERLFNEVNRLRLVHPGDLKRRPLHFRLENAQIA